MRSTALLPVLTLAALACAPVAEVPRATPGTEPSPATARTAEATGPEAAAQVAAESWLVYVDGGHYQMSWQGAAEGLRQQVTEEQWEQAARQVRQQVGDPRERILQEVRHTSDLPQAPPGEYVVLIYRTEFERATGIEQLVMVLEEDGQWRPVGYFVRP
jgi:hypothetical protein